MQAKPLRPGLDSLIAPLSRRAFFATHWGSRAFVTPGSASRVSTFLRDLGHADNRSLIRSGGGATQLQAWSKAPDGGITQRVLEPGTALGAYDAGETIFFSGITSLDAWRARLADDLGVQPKHLLLSAFASRAGSRTASHFDDEEVFTLQLLGSKRWRAARNRHIVNPTLNHHGHRTPQAKLLFQAVGPLPQGIPEPSVCYTMAPGWVSYLPKGYWHETEAETDSLSVILYCAGPSVGRVIAQALETLADRRPEWRATARLWSSRPSERARVRDELGRIIRALGTELHQLPAEAFAPPPPRPIDDKAVFERNPLAALHVTSLRDEDFEVRMMRQIGDGLQGAAGSFDRALLAPCKWISLRTRPFTLTQLLRTTTVPREELRALLALLERERVVIRREQAGRFTVGGAQKALDRSSARRLRLKNDAQ